MPSLKSGAQVNMKDNGGRTALHWTVHKVRDDDDDDESVSLVLTLRFSHIVKTFRLIKTN